MQNTDKLIDLIVTNYSNLVIYADFFVTDLKLSKKITQKTFESLDLDQGDEHTLQLFSECRKFCLQQLSRSSKSSTPSFFAKGKNLKNVLPIEKEILFLNHCIGFNPYEINRILKVKKISSADILQRSRDKIQSLIATNGITDPVLFNNELQKNLLSQPPIFIDSDQVLGLIDHHRRTIKNKTIQLAGFHFTLFSAQILLMALTTFRIAQKELHLSEIQYQVEEAIHYYQSHTQEERPTLRAAAFPPTIPCLLKKPTTSQRITTKNESTPPQCTPNKTTCP